MTEKFPKRESPLDRFFDEMAEDSLAASDEEIRAELEEDGFDVGCFAQKMRDSLDVYLMSANKAKMAAAKAGLARANAALSRSGEVTDIGKARARLRQAIKRGEAEGLTLAARKESELSDSDVIGMIDDLKELGLIDDDLPPDES